MTDLYGWMVDAAIMGVVAINLARLVERIRPS